MRHPACWRSRQATSSEAAKTSYRPRHDPVSVWSMNDLISRSVAYAATERGLIDDYREVRDASERLARGDRLREK